MNPISGNVLANDTDVDTQDILTVSQVNDLSSNVGQAVRGIYGTITINANGSYSYQLDTKNPIVQTLGQGQTLQETFTYQNSDNKEAQAKRH